VLAESKVKISMPLVTLLRNALPVIDGKGRWIDNRMIERLWRSLKYECVYLHAFGTCSEAKAGIGKWQAYYNVVRPHSTLGILTPDEAYARKTEQMRIAA
jgi:transposase InsO family protein